MNRSDMSGFASNSSLNTIYLRLGVRFSQSEEVVNVFPALSPPSRNTHTQS